MTQLSEEHKRKISNSLKDTKRSESFKEGISDRMKNLWANKNSKFRSLEYKEKQIAKLLGRKHSPEHNKKISESNKGKKNSLYNLERVKEKLNDPLYKTNHSLKMKLWWGNPKNKEHMSSVHKKRFENPENLVKRRSEILKWVKSDPHKQKVSMQTKARWVNNLDWKNKIALGVKKKWEDPIFKQKMSNLIGERSKKLWKNPNYRLKMMNTIMTSYEKHKFKFCNTKIEKMCAVYLEKLGINFIAQYIFMNKYACDFAVPEIKLIIECDGKYWHSFPNIIEKDKRKDQFIRENGWDILRLQEAEILNNKKYCIEKIIEFSNKRIVEFAISNSLFKKYNVEQNPPKVNEDINGFMI